MGDVGEAILKGLEQLGARIDASIAQMNARIDASIAKVNAHIDASIAQVNARIDASIAQVNARIDVVSARLDDLSARVDKGFLAVDGRLSMIEGRLSKVETAVAELDTRFNMWPDMHYLAGAARAQMVHSREIKAEVIELRIKLGEIYQAMATDPEIDNLRDEVGRFRDRNLEFDARLGAVESRLGIKPNPLP